jgi:glycosyltransferase involved in cell wall biosynthesis
MKVLHLINRPQMRGAEMFAVRVASRLQERGVENALCSLYEANGRNDYFDTGDLPIYELNVRTTLFDRIFRIDPKVAFKLRRVLREFEPDIVIGHGADNLKYTSLAGYLHKGITTVYKNIGTASFWANTRGRVWFNRFWLRGIDCTVSVSEITRQDFVEHYSFEDTRSIYIPNAIQIEDFDRFSGPAVRQEVRDEIGVSDDDIVVCMVGSLSRGKGQDTLIRSISRLRAKGHPVKLTIVGNGPERENLVRMANEEGVSDRVTFLGLRKDVPRVLAGMDIFALASLSEGMPGVLIEAGMAGLPSVAFDVGGVKEVLNHESTGLMLPSGDFEGFVDALSGLCNRPERRAELGEQARAWCRSRFNIDSVARQYQELFERLLQGELPERASSSATAQIDQK